MSASSGEFGVDFLQEPRCLRVGCER